MNHSDQETFGDLLTEAVHKIKLQEGKNISLIQDKLGLKLGREGGSPITYWRRGNVPSKLSDLENLARAIHSQIQLDQGWWERFLRARDHPNPNAFLKGLLSETTVTADQGLSSLYLPGKNYRTLVGRDDEKQQLQAALIDGDGRWLIGIDGMGGCGKTALAREMAEWSLRQAHFEAVVWLSAEPSQGNYQTTGNETLTFERILDTIGSRLNQPEIAELSQAQKEERIRGILRRKRILIVLDNLESLATTTETQADIIRQLQPFLGFSKAILTSRHRFKEGDIYTLSLKGLDKAASVSFMRQAAYEKGIDIVHTASESNLEELYQVVEGSPLALKLIVSQLLRWSPSEVSNRLRDGKSALATSDNEYTRFYKFIFWHSWELLNNPSQRLLLAMGNFDPHSGGNFAAIKATSGLSPEHLMDGIDTLWQFSFLEVAARETLSAELRYYLHILTRYFILSDLVKGV